LWVVASLELVEYEVLKHIRGKVKGVAVKDYLLCFVLAFVLPGIVFKYVLKCKLNLLFY
jgi:hypothetical protein